MCGGGGAAVNVRGMTTPTRRYGSGRDDIRVLVVDSSRILRETLAELVEYMPGMRSVGAPPTGEQALVLVEQECPDVIIVDTGLPDMSGPKFVAAARKAYPPVHIIGFSLSPDEPTQQSLLRAGANAFVSKDVGVEELVAVIRKLGLVPEPARTECETKVA